MGRCKADSKAELIEYISKDVNNHYVRKFIEVGNLRREKAEVQVN